MPQHTLQHLHEFVPISDTQSLIQQANKGKYMNTLVYEKLKHTGAFNVFIGFSTF
jgi:hypothetical protein